MIGWLNDGARNRAARDRVVRLIDLFKIATEKSQQLRSAKLEGKPGIRQTLSLTPELDRIQRDINRILRRHRSFPHVWLSEYGIRPAGVMTNRRRDASDDLWPQNEFAAVEAVLHLVRIEKIGKVKRCRCGLWFFARFGHVRFHSPKCRQQEHRSSPAYKAKRNEYARKLYHLHHSGKVKER